MTSETESVDGLIAAAKRMFREGASHQRADELLDRIAAAHARDTKDAARYRRYRATTVKPILFGDDGWIEADTDAAIDAMPRVEVFR